MLWSTVSKAFFKSINTLPLSLPASMLASQRFAALIKAVEVEWLGLKPDWDSVRLPAWKYSNSWECMTLSIIFEMAGRIEIGRQLLGIFLSSDLKIGCTFAFFQSSGNITVDLSLLMDTHLSRKSICRGERGASEGDWECSVVYICLDQAL